MKIKKIGDWFTQIVPGWVSWPIVPTRKAFLARGKTNVVPP
jgi:hypothetical protein